MLSLRIFHYPRFVIITLYLQETLSTEFSLTSFSQLRHGVFHLPFKGNTHDCICFFWTFLGTLGGLSNVKVPTSVRIPAKVREVPRIHLTCWIPSLIGWAADTARGSHRTRSATPTQTGQWEFRLCVSLNCIMVNLKYPRVGFFLRCLELINTQQLIWHPRVSVLFENYYSTHWGGEQEKADPSPSSPF